MPDERENKKEETQIEIKQYEPEKVLIEPFDETVVGYMKVMQEQNNIYAGLRQQEETLRLNLNNIKNAIHELRRMRNEELRTIYMPYLNGLKQITPERRNEFIKINMDMYHSFEIQYKSVQGQRINRADELGEARLRVLKRLWGIMIAEHGMKQEDLIQLVDHKDYGKLQALLRPKTELPKSEMVKI